MTQRAPLLVVGPGAAGRALGAALERAGWPLLGFVGRTAQSASLAASRCGGRALGSSDSPGSGWEAAGIVVVAVRDDDIPAAARTLVGWGSWRGRVVLHLSGGLDAGVLQEIRARGAAVGSMHPLMTFPPREGGEPAPWPADTPLALEGEREAIDAAARLAGALGAPTVLLGSESKAAWHAAATIAGNLSTVLVGAGAQVLDAIGVEDGASLLAPLARESVAAAAELGAAGALTGPVARGDVATLVRHREALEHALPGHDGAVLREAHALLSLAALELVRSRLPAETVTQLRAVLEAAAETARSERLASPGALPKRRGR